MNDRANYNIVRETPLMVLLQDIGPWDQYKTITNAPETVVAEMIAQRLGERRLFYIDSSGETDELLITDGAFAGFTSGNAGRADGLID